MSPQVLSRYEAALHEADPLLALRRTVKARLAADTSEEVLAELEEMRSRLQAEHAEALEDIVLEVMDAITGFSSPSVRIA